MFRYDCTWIVLNFSDLWLDLADYFKGLGRYNDFAMSVEPVLKMKCTDSTDVSYPRHAREWHVM